MESYILDTIKGGDNGLYLIQAPTGYGKTYNVVNAIRNLVETVKGHLEKEGESGRKLIYLTTLNKNVISRNLEKALGTDTYNRSVLHIRANLDEVREKILDPSFKVPEKFRNEAYDQLRRALKNYDEEEEKKKRGIRVEAKYLELLREEANVAEREYRHFIAKSLRDAVRSKHENGDDGEADGASRKEKKLDAIRYDKRYRWIGQLYPAVFTDERQVLLMSVSKFLKKNSTIVEASYSFLEAPFLPNSVIFIDEFDATKETVRMELIRAALKMDEEYISLFRHLASGLSKDRMTRALRLSCAAAGEPEYNALVQKAEAISEEYNTDRNFKTDRDSVSRKNNYIFRDTSYHTFSNDRRRYVRVTVDAEENRNTIFMESREAYYAAMAEHEEQRKAYDEFVKSGKESTDPPKEPARLIQLYSMLREIDAFIMRFNLFLQKWGEAYADVVNSGRKPSDERLTVENAKNSILRHMSISEKGKAIIMGLVPVSRKKHVSDDLLPDNSYYRIGYRILDLIDDDGHNENTDIRLFKLSETPEKLLVYLAQNATVIGISATAEIPTVLGNYDLEYLGDVLGPLFHLTPSSLTERIEAELRPKYRAYEDGSVKVDASVLPMTLVEESVEKTCRSFFDNSAVADVCANLITNTLEIAGEGDNDYYAARYCDLAQAMRWFCGAQAKSMLSLSMGYPRNDWRLDESLLKKIMELCRTDAGLTGNEPVLYVLHDNYDDSKDELLKRLADGEKIYVMSSYKTIGAGQNLQYAVKDMDGLVDIYPEKKGADARNEQKDFDAIFLGDVTNAVVNLQGEQLDREALMTKITQVMELQEHGELSREQTNALLKRAMNKHYGEFEQRPEDDELRYDASYDTDSVHMLATQTVIQAVGRMCRTHIKNRTITIFLEGRLLDKLSHYELGRHSLLPEIAAIRDLVPLRAEENAAREKTRIQNTAEKVSNSANNFIRSILSRGWAEREIDLWNRLRPVVMRYPVASEKDRSEIDIIKRLYITSGKKQNEYMYLQTGDFSNVTLSLDMDRKALEAVKKRDPSVDGYIMTMSAQESRLPYILKYPGMKDYFDSMGYACCFEPNDYMMSPIIFNNIYKGALGETAGSFIFKHELGIAPEPITEPDVFEFFDFLLAPDVYVDFKNWKLSYNVSRDTVYAEIERKMEKIGGKKAYIVNIVGPADSRPVVTAGGHIVEIPALIDKNGNINLNAVIVLKKELS